MNTDILYLIDGWVDNLMPSLSGRQKARIHQIITHALNMTHSYIASIRNNQEDFSSPILSGLWLNASHELKRFRKKELKQFAKELEMKSRFWANPKKFKKSDLKTYNIKLEQVEEKLNLLAI